MNNKTSSGQTYPLGATVYSTGVNFSIFSKNCSSIELLLFDTPESLYPSQSLVLDPKQHKTFYYWHIFVEGIGHGQVYAYRVHGPYNLAKGYRFDGNKVLLDPYTRAVFTPSNYSRKAAKEAGDNCPIAMRSVVINSNLYDWEGDTSLCHPFSRTIIYELHVGGFTKNQNSKVSTGKHGTYAGLIEKIPYLQELGVTAVELLPVQQFDEQDAPPGLSNYWGYSPIAFFAPHNAYASSKTPVAPVDEFRDMVKALHKAGIEVILDVVFNHTAEFDATGPILSFRGLENKAYYILDEDKALYKDYTGCGNSLNANHSIVKKMIIDCLHYWVTEMHVDGFRFDLASVLARDTSGNLMENPPLLWAIDSDPVLAGTKIIAEPWDAAGLSLAGDFIGHKWAEWNGIFRDELRRMLRGDVNTVKPMTNRIAASYDIYAEADRDANRSINFVTCHDGFTLNDLVTYNQKYNLANGEQNNDGSEYNFSWNCGLEGPGQVLQIEQLRLRQIKNFFSVLLLSQGTPMLCMGDEVRRSQKGNNNAYCQNNELSWFDWDLVKQHKDLFRFVKMLIHFNLNHQAFQDEGYWINSTQGKPPRITWHGTKAQKPDLAYHSHSLAYLLDHSDLGEYLYVIINAYSESLDFELPPIANWKNYQWYRMMDTFQPSPQDFCTKEAAAPLINGKYYRAAARSVVLLMAR